MGDKEGKVAEERAVAFVVARLSSSRLPNKQFRSIGEKTILEWIVGRLRNCKELEEIVIATVAEACNEPLRAFAEREGLPCFWYEGEVDHVTTRLRRAAEAFNADVCVLISADCPLVHAPAVDHLIRELRSNPKADYVVVASDARGQRAATEGIAVARRRAWQLADDLSDTPELKEHQFPAIRLYRDRFIPHECCAPQELYGPHHRFSVDTYADLQFMDTVFKAVINNGHPFEMPWVLQALRENPPLRNINVHVHQRLLKEARHSVLCILDSGQEFGYGHLMRSQELALQIVERMGWPVAFLVDDERSATLIEGYGLRVFWGALGRPANAPPSHRAHQMLEDLVPRHTSLLLDLSQRTLARGWRQKVGASIPTVVLGNSHEWACEADLIIMPGVTGPERPGQEGPFPNNTQSSGDNGEPPLLSGWDYVILRRETREQIAQSENKAFDILACLHHSRQRELVRNFAADQHLRVHILEGFDPHFTRLLANAHIYLTEFDYSFYDALALHAYPVSWPYSAAQENDARIFYSRVGLAETIIKNEGSLKTILGLLSESRPNRWHFADGTPAIVQAISRLLCK